MKPLTGRSEGAASTQPMPQSVTTPGVLTAALVHAAIDALHKHELRPTPPVIEQPGEQPTQFGYSIRRGTYHGGTAYITCALCDGRVIAMLTLTREQFSDIHGRERTLNMWAAITEGSHNRAIHNP